MSIYFTSWALLLAGESGGRWVALATTPVLVVVLLVIAAEAGGYYIQGESFSEGFFNHILLPGGHRGAIAYPGELALALFTLCLVLLLHLLALRLRPVTGWSRRRVAFSAFVLLCIGLSLSPLPRFVQGYLKFRELVVGTGSTSSSAFVRPEVAKEQLISAAGKNVVILYLESFDSIYLDNDVFSDLTPNLSRYARENMLFTGMRDYPGIGFTMAGIFSSQCGIPFSIGRGKRVDDISNNITRSQYAPSHVCLGDVLRSSGYKQAFLGGADAKFAGKSNFFSLHGYDEIYGLSDWQKSGEDSGNTNQWGLFDDKLFDLAASKYEELASGSDPFNLTVLTLDTHGPGGIASPSCPSYPGSENSILQAVHCTDALVGAFIDRISKNPKFKDTVLVVMGDHASMRNEAHDLHPDDYVRTPVFMIVNSGQAGEHAAEFYHMDIAPTLLSLMGVESNAQFVAGWVQADPSQRNGPALGGSTSERIVLADMLYGEQPDVQLCGGDEMLSWASDGRIEIGGQRVSLRENGYPIASMPEGASAIAILFRKMVTYTVADPNPVVPQLNDGEIAFVIRSQGDEGAGRYTVVAHNRHGGTVKLADGIDSLKSLSLLSKQCEAIERAMRTTRGDLDKSGDISVVADVSMLPLSAAGPFRISESAPKDWFIAGWSEPTAGGVWAVGQESRLTFAAPSEACGRNVAKFKMTPYVSAARPGLRVLVYPLGQPEKAASARFEYAKPAAATVAVDVDGELDEAGNCLMKFVFQSERDVDDSKEEAPADAWPIMFSLESINVMPQ
ncbi:LTA synthase family protein [Pseudoxanthomonas koreensis]|uniref:LTA synthase family protein n=1 Tax=Pseudoxanthomonas koreensis TaxID=266061 RepID=UPI0013910027|nr:LTA synthase family protein [Pseudoxanthomonas koreensis]